MSSILIIFWLFFFTWINFLMAKLVKDDFMKPPLRKNHFLRKSILFFLLIPPMGIIAFLIIGIYVFVRVTIRSVIEYFETNANG